MNVLCAKVNGVERPSRMSGKLSHEERSCQSSDLWRQRVVDGLFVGKGGLELNYWLLTEKYGMDEREVLFTKRPTGFPKFPVKHMLA